MIGQKIYKETLRSVFGQKFHANNSMEHRIHGTQHVFIPKLTHQKKLRKASVFKTGIRQQSALSDNEVLENFVVR
jgi:hypothetical protein